MANVESLCAIPCYTYGGMHVADAGTGGIFYIMSYIY